jgi:hypothetical protein
MQRFPRSLSDQVREKFSFLASQARGKQRWYMRERPADKNIGSDMCYAANQSNALVGLHEVAQAAKQYPVASP